MLKSLEVCNSLLFLVPFHCGWLVSSNHHGQHSIIDLFLGPGGVVGSALIIGLFAVILMTLTFFLCDLPWDIQYGLNVF